MEVDFDLFCENPTEYIQNRVQTISEKPDLGIGNMISTVIKQDPSVLNNIPYVRSTKDIMDTKKFTTARIRIVMRNLISSSDVIPLSIEQNGTKYTYLAENLIPGGSFENPIDVDSFLILAELLTNVSNWEEEVTEQPAEFDAHVIAKKMATSHSAKKGKTFVQLRLVQEILKFNIAFDVIGFFINSAEIDEEFNTEATLSLPTFFGLGIIPVQEFYNLPAELQPFDIQRGRNLTLAYLKSFLEPNQAELVLLWLVSRVRNEDRIGVVQIGIFSLNLFGISHEEAVALTALLEHICSAVKPMAVNIASMNRGPLVQDNVESELAEAPLSTFNGERFIFDETELEPGELNEVGTLNMATIERLVVMQELDIMCGSPFKQYVSNPCLVLSRQRSVLTCDARSPAGNLLEPLELPSEEEIALIRYYVDSVRMRDFAIQPDDEGTIQDGLLAVMKGDEEINETDLHLLTNFASNLALSHGSAHITPEIWARAADLFGVVYQFKK